MRRRVLPLMRSGVKEQSHAGTVPRNLTRPFALMSVDSDRSAR